MESLAANDKFVPNKCLAIPANQWMVFIFKPHGEAYLEVYPRGLGNGRGGSHDPEPLCFVAQIVDISSDDFLILNQTYKWEQKKTMSVAFVPWDSIGAIRVVSIGGKTA